MKINKTLFFLLIGFLCYAASYSQQADLQTVVKSYQKEIKLNDIQENQLKIVLEKFDPQFKKEELTVKDFNVLLKKETLEIYNILSPEQFGVYKKLKESIEPSKKYKFENK